MSITDGIDGHNQLMEAIDSLAGTLQIQTPVGDIGLKIQAWQVSAQQAMDPDRSDYYYVTTNLSLAFTDVSGQNDPSTAVTLKGYVLTLTLSEPLTVPPAPGSAPGTQPIGQVVLTDPQFPQTTELSQTYTANMSETVGFNIGFFGDLPTGGFSDSTTFGASWSETIPGVTYQNESHQPGVDPHAAQWSCTYTDDSMDSATNDFDHAALWQVTIPAKLAAYYESQRKKPQVAGGDRITMKIGLQLLFHVPDLFSTEPEFTVGFFVSDEPIIEFTDGVVFTMAQGQVVAGPGLNSNDQRFVPSSITNSDPYVILTTHMTGWLDGVQDTLYTLTFNLDGIEAAIPKPPQPERGIATNSDDPA